MDLRTPQRTVLAVPPGEFVVQTEQWDARTVVVTVQGEVDLVTAPDVEAELRKAVDVRARHVVVDLSGVTFFDSSAVHALVAGSKQLRAGGTDVRIVCNVPAIRRVLEITSVDRVFLIYATVEDATTLDTAARQGR